MKIYSQNDVRDIATILKNDGVVSVPTDTVYGLCARVNSPIAYSKLVKIKNRPSNKSFPIICNSIEQIKSIAIVNKQIEILINSFMPGPITLVLNKNINSNYINNAGVRKTNELAVRMAPSKFLKELIDEVGCPLFMTSANKSGEDICKSLEEIKVSCPDIDGMVSGDVSFGISSTIVDCTGKEIKIQRLGPISEEEIRNALSK